jgi:uncharacterized protein
MDKPRNILITGASGLIGSKLTHLLQQRGYTVSHLGRSRRSGPVKSYLWDVEKQTIEAEAINTADVIIHLAGASVAEKRWTDNRKKEIRDSRIHSTRLLHNALRTSTRVKTLISASAIGYYGFESNEWLDENSPAGKDFLADVTREWESEVDKIGDYGIRIVKMRIGIVLSESGGALEQMAKPVRMFAGAPLGTGQQFVSWIHIDDVCGIFLKAVEDESMRGPYNVVAPEPVTNKQLTQAIASKLKKPLFLPPVPKIALKVILGEMADIVVTGSRVSPKKVLNAGYLFKYARVGHALDDLLKK